MVPIVIASHNRHKQRELKEHLKALSTIGEGFDVMTLHSFPHYRAPSTGPDLDKAAAAKALSAAQAFGCWALADASGLFVPALGHFEEEETPIRSSHSRDTDKRRELLDKMHGMTHLKRAAVYRCSLAIASPEGVQATAHATCEGMITEEERGGAGFGYDPLFKKHDYDKTFGELEDHVRYRISHRRKAFDKLSNSLERLLAATPAGG